MNRRSVHSLWFLASLAVVLTAFGVGCTDPNTQVNDARSAERAPSDYSRLAR